MSAREVTLVGGSPWGFRMHGGHDLYQPLRISRVNPGSKAAQQGVREGDLISSINDRNTKDLTNGEAHALLRNAGDQLKLGLNQETVGSPKRRIYKSSLQENTSIETLKKTTKTTTTSSTRLVSSNANKASGSDDTRTERGTVTNSNGTVKDSQSATECSSADTKTKRSTKPSTVQTSGYITEDCDDHWQNPRMPRSSRGRKNRRNRNNKRANCVQQKCERQEKSRESGDKQKGDNSGGESPTNDGRIDDAGDYIGTAEIPDEILDISLPIAHKSAKLPDNFPSRSNCHAGSINHSKNDEDKIAKPSDLEEINEKGSAGNLVEAVVNGHPIKVTTEESACQFDNDVRSNVGKIQAQRKIKSKCTKRSSLVPASGATAERRKLRIERRAVIVEPTIFEITSLSDNSPLAASISHVAGVGIIEAGTLRKEEIEGTIVTVSEPVEPVRPLPNAVASKVAGLALGKCDLEELTLLARATINNNNNDDDDENERSSDGPDIREVTDSDAETDNSTNSRPTTGATYVIEAESDIERDSVLDLACDSVIAEETEDENVVGSESSSELKGVEIPKVISGTSELKREGSTGDSGTVETVITSQRRLVPSNVEIAQTPPEGNSEAIENISEQVVQASESRDPSKEISAENLDSIKVNCQVYECENERLPEGISYGLSDHQESEEVLRNKTEDVINVKESGDAGSVEKITLEICNPDETVAEPGEKNSGGNVVENSAMLSREILTTMMRQFNDGIAEERRRARDENKEDCEKIDDKTTLTNEQCTKLVNGSSNIEINKPCVKEKSKVVKFTNDANVSKEKLPGTAGASNFNESIVYTIPVVVEKRPESAESSVTKEVENKLRLFIEGLELPTFNDEPPAIDHQGLENERERGGNSAQRRVKKRAIQDPYYVEAKHADRFLDIIQEEGEKLSEGDERHIRDFINEEISKFRRKERHADHRLEFRVMDAEKLEEFTKTTNVQETRSKTNSSTCDHRDNREIVTTERTEKTVTTTHETEKSTKETQVMVTKILTNEENKAACERTENVSTIEGLEEKSRFEVDNADDGICNGFSDESKYFGDCREQEPPVPPRRFLSHISDEETVQPPTPPVIDYPTDVPKIPELPVEYLAILQQPPVPPKRKSKLQPSTDEPPERPPLPVVSNETKNRTTEERIYENVEYPRNMTDSAMDQVPPPLPPLPRNFENLEKERTTFEDLSKIPIASECCHQNPSYHDVKDNTRVISSPEILSQEYRQESHRLRNPQPIDEANKAGYTAGNDAHFEIVSSVGNRCVYNENAATMRLAAPLSSRKTAAANFGQPDLTRQWHELTDEISQTGGQCAIEADIIRSNKQNSGEAGRYEVAAKNHRENVADFYHQSNVTLRNNCIHNDKVKDSLTCEDNKFGVRSNERTVLGEKVSEKLGVKNEAFFESTDRERKECHREEICDKVSSTSEKKDEQCEKSFREFKKLNSEKLITQDTERLIFDSRITSSIEKADSRVCVENNQTEKPAGSPHRQQHSCFSSSASSSSRLLRTETCASQGEANSVTTTENKNSDDDESRTLPTLMVTKTLEEKANLILRSPSPERNEVADDQESLSSGAATPNTVRFNPSNSLADLVALEDRGELEVSNKDNRSFEGKLANPGVCNYVKIITDKSQALQHEQDLFYVPLQYQNRLSTQVELEGSEDARPDLLKDLCIRKILSLPYGLHIINEITLPKFNVFKSIQAIQRGVNGGVDCHPETSRSNQADDKNSGDTSSNQEMKKQRPKTWMGVPTTDDPKILVCLSPSQQEYQVRTSVDNLLDLHKKFLNRQSYHEDRRNVIDVPKYWVGLEKDEQTNANTQLSRQDLDQPSHDSKSSGPGNRLLAIIKENPIESSNQSPHVAAGRLEKSPYNTTNNRASKEKANSRDLREDRLRATKLSDWLDLARRDSQDYPLNRREAKNSCTQQQDGIESASDRSNRANLQPTRMSYASATSEADNMSDTVNTRDSFFNKNAYSSPENERTRARCPLVNDLVTRTIVDNSYEKVYDQVISKIEHNNRQFSKRSSGESPRLLDTTPIHQYEKCPISLKSAIIEKSTIPNNESPSKQTGALKWMRGLNDPRHNVNPALIDDKSDDRECNETIKCSRPMFVDRSCIDTTSIFDKTPPSGRLAPRRCQDPETLKQDTAADIMKCLKHLQSNDNQQRGSNIGGGRRRSLPQEYFDRQLCYIEQLENQLRDVILAEEDERKAYEEFLSHANRELEEKVRSTNDPTVANGDTKSGKAKVTLNSDVPGNDERESWHEESMTREGHRTEFSKKAGHKEATKSLTDQGDLRVEKSTTNYENVEEKLVSSTSGDLNGVSPETDVEWKDLYGADAQGKWNSQARDEEEGSKGSNANSARSPKVTKASGIVPPNGEVFRRKMFDEYVHKVHEREERKQHKVIKISSHIDNRENSSVNTGMSKMEREFIERARNRMSRFGIKLDDSGESEAPTDNDSNSANKIIANDLGKDSSVKVKMMADEQRSNCETAKCLIDGREIRDPKSLPKHLQEFLELATIDDSAKDGFGSGIAAARRKTNATDLLYEIDTALKIGKGFLLGEESVMFAPTFKASSAKPGVWSPGSEPPPPPQEPSPERGKNTEKDAGIPPVWTPSSAGASPVADRKEFRPVAFESPVLSRKKFASQTPLAEPPPPWKDSDIKREDVSQSVNHNITTRIVNSHSAPSQGLNSLAGTPRLPRAQNPTITLLQKAREGQLPKGAAYLEDGDPIHSNVKSHASPRGEPVEIIHTIKMDYESEPETSRAGGKKMTDQAPRKIEGIGPTTKDGIPVALRSEVKDSNQARWYKKMYDSLHRADKDDDYVTVRYKPRRGARYGYGSSSGYLSEPEPRIYSERSATLDTRRRQRNKENDFSTSTMPRKTAPLNSQSEVYRTQPGRIENYEPGRSSIADRETKEWWDEVMDIFDGWLDDNRHVRSDRGADNNGMVLPSLGMSHRTSRVLSLSYRPDASDSVSLLSPLTSSHLAKTSESSSSTIAQRLNNVQYNANHSSTSQSQKLVRNRPSMTEKPIAKSKSPKDTRTNPVGTSLTTDLSTESLKTSTMEHSLYAKKKSPIDSDQRVKSIISRKNQLKVNGGSSVDRENVGSVKIDNCVGKEEKDRIIRPLADAKHYSRYALMPEGKSKSFVLPDRDSIINERMLATITGSQSNLLGIGVALGERASLAAESIIRKDCQQYDEQQLCHHRHHHHRHHHNHRHHHHHQLQRCLQISDASTASTTTSSSSSSTPCTFSTIRNVTTLLPSSMPTIANNITAKNPQSAASSRPFDQHNQHTTKPYMSHALKESGYESDSTLIFRRRDDASPLSPLEQRLAYKTIQKGGDVPLHGLRKPAPERLKDNTEIEYFPISPTLTRIRVRRRKPAAVTKAEAASMSSSASSMTFARYKRTAVSAPANSSIPPNVRIATGRNGTRSVVGRTSSTISTSRTTITTTRTTSPPPGRPPTRVTSPRAPSPPRRRSSRHNATLRTFFVENRRIERSSSCPDRSRVCSANQRHQQCFAAESASNIRFLRERLSNKLSGQIREREIARKHLGTVRSPSSPSLTPKKKSPAPFKPSQLELLKRKSEPCLNKKVQECSISSARRNVYPSTRTITTSRQVSRSASPLWRNSQEHGTRQKTICDSRIHGEEKPPVARSSPKSLVKSSGTSSSGLGTTVSTSRQKGPSKLSSTLVGKADQAKACRTKKATRETSKRFPGSFTELISPTEGKKGLAKHRGGDCAVRSPSSNSSAIQRATTSSAHFKPTSVEGKSSRKLSAGSSKSCTLPKLSPKEILSSKRNLASPTSAALHRTPSGTLSSTNKSKIKRSVTPDVRTSTSDSSIIATSEHSLRKRQREKPQTIVKQPPKKPTTIAVDPQRREEKTSKRPAGVVRDNRREPSRPKRVTSNADSGKRKSTRESTPKSSSSRAKEPPKMINKAPELPASSMECIKQHQQATRTDTFFQNLFLRNLSSPVPSQCSTVRRSSVMERARIFQECPAGHFKSEPSLRSLNVYLAQKRPVSNSRFKNWERESLSSRSSSPYGVSWPGRSVFKQVSKFCSLLGLKDFGSSSSLRGRSPNLMTDECAKERSLSEPPLKINSFQSTKTSERVASPVSRTSSPSPTRSAACRRIKSLKQQDKPETCALKTRTRSMSEADDCERKRSNLGSNLSLTKSTGSLESPPLNRDDYQRYLLQTIHAKRKSERYKDLYDFYASLERMGELEKTTSTSDLRPRIKDEEIIDYDRWKEMRCKERAEQELKELYGRLKNAQSSKNFLFSTNDVDKFKWRGDSGLRCKERSVENIKESFRRLENEESELESTRRREISSKKDVYKPLWRGSSVANVARKITEKNATGDDESERSSSVHPALQKHLGGSKKFWSSLSIEQVATLKNQLNEIYGSDVNNKPKILRGVAKSEVEKNAINREDLGKNRQEQQQKVSKSLTTKDNYEIVVPPEEEFGDGTEETAGLHVRCHSMLTSLNATKSEENCSQHQPTGYTSNFKRRGSIGNGRNLEILRTKGSAQDPPPLSEMEKKRLSLTLGKELLDKVTRRKASTTAIIPRETRGAIASATTLKQKSTSSSTTTSVTNTSPRTCYSFETSFDEDNPKVREKNDFLLVLTPNGNTAAIKDRVENVLDEWSRKPPLLAMALPADASTKGVITSGSEFDSTTESSETSVRTVVRRGSEAEVVPRKVEFFEKIKKDGQSVDDKMHQHSERLSSSRPSTGIDASITKKKTSSKLSSAQSFADLKELFGESQLGRYTTLPFRDIGPTLSTSPDSDHRTDGSESGRGGRSISVSPDVTRERAASAWQSLSSGFHDPDMERARSLSPCQISTSTCSLESFQNRSVSPDPERYWRAYLNLVKNGSVKKLRAKFESLEELTGDRKKLVLTPKRFQSDPELTRNLLKRASDERKTRPKLPEVTNVAWIRRKYEPTSRGRSRRRIARSPPIPRIPLRLEDLSMPRINVISKTAELKDNFPRSGSTDSLARKAETEELEAKRPVGRIREKFEKLDGKCLDNDKPSLLGEMFTSAPNVHELRDIAPYLAGRWVAHKYPSRRDNARSLSLPPDLENSGLGPSKKIDVVEPCTSRSNVDAKKVVVKRSRGTRGLSSSLSPVRPRTPNSILKQTHSDPFANQNFDPNIHRPRYRYQPPPPPPPPPALVYRRDTKTWWPPIPTYTAKPSVTFEGPILFDY